MSQAAKEPQQDGTLQHLLSSDGNQYALYPWENNCFIFTFKRKNQKKKNRKKKIEKKNLSATFHIFSKCHFLSHGKDVSGHQAVNGHPYQLTSN